MTSYVTSPAFQGKWRRYGCGTVRVLKYNILYEHVKIEKQQTGLNYDHVSVLSQTSLYHNYLIDIHVTRRDMESSRLIAMFTERSNSVNCIGMKTCDITKMLTYPLNQDYPTYKHTSSTFTIYCCFQ